MAPFRPPSRPRSIATGVQPDRRSANDGPSPDLKSAIFRNHFEEARVTPAVIDERAGTRDGQRVAAIGDLPAMRPMDVAVQHDVDFEVAQERQQVAGAVREIAL